MPLDTPVARLVLYTRAGCHLCDEAAELLDAVVGSDGYEAVAIEADDDLLVRYGHRIPVLALDGTDRLEGVISAAEVRELVLDAEPEDAPPR